MRILFVWDISLSMYTHIQIRNVELNSSIVYEGLSIQKPSTIVL